MANVTITIPDAVAGRVLDAVAAVHGYDASEGGPNEGVTKVQFAKDIVAKFLRSTVAGYEANKAAEAARQAALTSAQTDITIT